MKMQDTADELCDGINIRYDAGITERQKKNNTNLMADDLIPDELKGKAVDMAFECRMTSGLSLEFIEANLELAKPLTRAKYNHAKKKYAGQRGGWKKALERDQ